MELEARFRSSSRAFLRQPSMLAMRDLLAAYTLSYVAAHGGEEGLGFELDKIEQSCRNILAGLP